MRSTELDRHAALLKRISAQAGPQLSLFDEPLTSNDNPAIEELREWVETERHFEAAGGAQFVGIEDALRLYLAQPCFHVFARERGSAESRNLASEALLQFVASIVTDVEVRVPRELFQAVSVSEATRIVSTHLALHLSSHAAEHGGQRATHSARDSVAFDALVSCVSRGEQGPAPDKVCIDRNTMERAFQAPPGTVEYDFAVEFLLSPTEDFDVPTPSVPLMLEALRRASFRNQDFSDDIPHWLKDFFGELVCAHLTHQNTEGLKLVTELFNSSPVAFDELLESCAWFTARREAVDWLVSNIDTTDWDCEYASGLSALWISGLRNCPEAVFAAVAQVSEELRDTFFGHAIDADVTDELEVFVKANFDQMADVIRSGMPAMHDDSSWCIAVRLAWTICEQRNLSEIGSLIQINDWLSAASEWSGGVEDAGWSSIAELAQRIENCADEIGRGLTSDEWERLSGCVGDFCAMKNLLSSEDDEDE